MFDQIITSYKRQDQSALLDRLSSLNLTLSQFQRALTLVEYSPFLEIKNKTIESIVTE